MSLSGALRAGVRAARIGALAAETLVRAGATARAGGRAEVTLARAQLISRAARRALAVHGLELRVTGSVAPGPALLVANHLSYLDPLVVAACAPCLPVSKAELAAWPVLGAVARRTGVLFVERGSGPSRLAVIHAVTGALEGGARVLNFPEGTTSDGATVLRFRKGMFDAARRLGVPVVPVALAYAPRSLAWVGDATFVPHYLRLAALARPAVTVAFGAALPSRAYPTAEALAEAARDRTVALLEDRPEWLRMTR